MNLSGTALRPYLKREGWNPADDLVVVVDEVAVPAGEGVILTLEGSGVDARAQVNFGRHGMKWLALAIAKLTPID